MHPTEISTGIDRLIGYLDVCNAALEANRNTFPYKQLFDMYEKIFANRQVACMIYEDDPSVIQQSVTIQMIDGKFRYVPDSEAKPSFHLKVKRSYMEGVVRHRQEYIDHPEKLDWDWLKTRFGMEPHYKESERK